MPVPSAPPPGTSSNSYHTSSAPVVTSSGPSSAPSRTTSVNSSPSHQVQAVYHSPPTVMISAASPGAQSTENFLPPLSPAHTFTFTIIMKKITYKEELTEL